MRLPLDNGYIHKEEITCLEITHDITENYVKLAPRGVTAGQGGRIGRI